MSSVPLIQVKNLSLVLQGTTILHDITFSIERGAYVALIGPNGSGKTSLLKVLLDLHTPTSGSVVIGTKKIGYVPQKLDIDKTIPLTVQEFLYVFHTRKALVDNQILLHTLGVDQLLSKPLGSLSGGEQQKTLIVNALLYNPELLLFDEPTAGIDAMGEKIFHEFIDTYRKEHGTSIIVVSHDMHTVHTYATQVLCIKQTLKCHGTPEEVKSCDAFHELFEVAHTHIHHHHTL